MKIFSRRQPLNDRELVENFLATRGEAEFRTLYRCFTPGLYPFVLRMAGGVIQDTEEVVQDTWIRAVERLPDFRWESGFRTWLFAIAVNRCRELYRSRRKQGAEISADEAELPYPREFATTGEQIDLERAIAMLSDGYRRVFVLHDVEGYTHQEISELLKINIGTSKSQLFHARRAIRKYLLME